MATPITGAISFADLNSVLGVSAGTTISLNDTNVRRLTNQLSGAADLNNAHACAYLNSTVTNQNLLTGYFGSSGTVANYKFFINTSGVIGASSGSTALTLGQFASGSTIVINNYGAINAYGGAGGSSGVGSSGGDAIYATYSNQTVTINNQSGAFIRGGGGGGGKGGTGGQGSSFAYRYDGSNRWEIMSSQANGFPTYSRRILARWDGVVVINQDKCPDGITMSNPYGGYYIGSYQGYIDVTDCGGGGTDQRSYYQIGGNAITSGGVGGAGGRGQGYDGAAASGSAGSAGGTNAGTGGTGGTGGNYGSAGSTGSTGASGNYSAGSAGSAGGAAGRYLVKGGSSVTLNNSGTVAGGLA